jgi:hypothetical protein
MYYSTPILKQVTEQALPEHTNLFYRRVHMYISFACGFCLSPQYLHLTSHARSLHPNLMLSPPPPAGLLLGRPRREHRGALLCHLALGARSVRSAHRVHSGHAPHRQRGPPAARTAVRSPRLAPVAWLLRKARAARHAPSPHARLTLNCGPSSLPSPSSQPSPRSCTCTALLFMARFDARTACGPPFAHTHRRSTPGRIQLGRHPSADDPVPFLPNLPPRFPSAPSSCAPSLYSL